MKVKNKVLETVQSGSLESTKTNSRRSMIAKFLVMAILVSFVGISQTFAASGGIDVLDSAGDKILNLIGAKWVKAILAVALIIEFGVIAFGNAQGEGAVFKKVLPWVIGTAGILGATSVVNYFFGGINVEKLQGFVQPDSSTAVALQDVTNKVLSII